MSICSTSWTGWGVTPEGSRDEGLAYFEFDCMKLAEGILWTDVFASIFREKRGYDIQKYLIHTHDR